MRILVVYPYVPYPVDRGTYQRTFHLLKALAAEHEVDLLALDEGGARLEHQSVFEGFCQKVKFVPFQHPSWPKLFPGRVLNPIPTTVRHWKVKAFEEAIDEFVLERNYDLVHVCDIVMAQYFLKKHTHLPLAVDRSRVDLQFQLAQRSAMSKGIRQTVLDLENLAKLSIYEKRVAGRATVQIVCGPDDKNFIRARISKRSEVQVVTNGVDLEYFSPEAASTSRSASPTVLFCGAMDYSPNIDALRWYFSEMHEDLQKKVPGLEVLIVGRSPIDEVKAYGLRPGVTVTGGVSDVRPYYRKAWVQIVPLRIGGGTRLKIPESMAMGTPVVSTSIGAQGLDLKHGSDVLLADSPADFVHETALALTYAGLRSNIESEAVKTATRRFSLGTSWEPNSLVFMQSGSKFEFWRFRRVRWIAAALVCLAAGACLAFKRQPESSLIVYNETGAFIEELFLEDANHKKAFLHVGDGESVFITTPASQSIARSVVSAGGLEVWSAEHAGPLRSIIRVRNNGQTESTTIPSF